MMEMAKAYGAMATSPGGSQGLMQYLILRDTTLRSLQRQLLRPSMASS
jgi:hypothetical protein